MKTFFAVFFAILAAAIVIGGAMGYANYKSGTVMHKFGQEKGIFQNLGIISRAADQYFDEHPEKKEVRVSELIGSEKPIAPGVLFSYDGEQYESLVIHKNEKLHVKTQSGLEVSY